MEIKITESCIKCDNFIEPYLCFFKGNLIILNCPDSDSYCDRFEKIKEEIKNNESNKENDN